MRSVHCLVALVALATGSCASLTRSEEPGALLSKAMTASVARRSAREIALTDLAGIQLYGPDASISDDPRPAFRAMGMTYHERLADSLLK